jgi:hypothetical protein
MVEGRYIYCIMDWDQTRQTAQLGNIGIKEMPVFVIAYKALGAVVSSIPFKEMESNMNDIVAHQRVVEAARQLGTVLPVRFGVILKTQDGVSKLLASSYKDYVTKIARLRGKDEMGIKVLLNKSSLRKFQEQAQRSEDAVNIKDQIANSKPGASYFLKLKLGDAVKNEMLKAIDKMAGDINRVLSQQAEETRLLKNDLEEIVLNAAYLIDHSRLKDFDAMVTELRKKYEKEGMTLHTSGPWAPYSFC